MKTSETSEHEVIPVFWTGGRDSTFRVLQLAVQYSSTVQPFYVVDRTRRSFQLEIEAIERLRRKFLEDFPDRAHLLLKPIVLEREEIAPSTLSEHPFMDYAREHRVSIQYPYLYSAVLASDYDRIEVSVQSGDNVTLIPFLRERMIAIQHPNGVPTNALETWDPGNKEELGFKLFESFLFPTYYLNPIEMDQMADELGVLEVLDLCWTCHFPFRGEPCGTCVVCKYAIETGKLRGYPRSALRRYKYRRIVHPIHMFINNPKGVARKMLRYLRPK